MIKYLDCDTCAFQTKCVAYNKMKPFLEDARVDLGVTLVFDSCVDYSSTEEQSDQENKEENIASSIPDSESDSESEDESEDEMEE